jgi:HPt (histidine-containing phosphotransfer) domain-containing protein
VTPVLDTGRLREICRGDVELMRDILGTLVAEARTLIVDVRAAVVARDGERAVAAAHALKGIAGNVGALRLEETAAELQDAVVLADWPHALCTVESLHETLDAVRRSGGALERS